jgi:hypothetical protein
MSDFYPATGLTGGASGALDAIDGASLADGDVAVVVLHAHATYGDALLVYVLDADSAATEASPDVIAPDANAGDKRWVLATFAPLSVQARQATITQASTDTLAGAECTGQTITNYGQSAANTQTLPAAAAGLHGQVVIATAGQGAFHLKAGSGDKIYLDGVALDDGDKVSLAAPAVGDTFSFAAFQTGALAWDWMVWSTIGALTDGGA